MNPSTPFPTNQTQMSDAELGALGVTRIPADVFLWGGFRYSNARDAVAAAKRGASA